MATSPALLNWYNNNNQATRLSSKTTLAAPTGMINQVKNWQVTPDQTVEQHVSDITQKDSPLMQQARTAGNQEAQSRGLLNSSIGIQAAQDSVLKAAVPIAQSDAATAVRAAGYNVDTYNQANQTNNQNLFNRQERIANNAYDLLKTNTNNAYDLLKTNTNNAYDLKKTNVNNAYDLKKTNVNNAYDASKTTYTTNQQNTQRNRELFAGMANDFTKQMTQINQDPNMTQQAKDWAIKQIYDSYKSNLNIVTQVGNVPNVSNLLKNWSPTEKPSSSYRNYVAPPTSDGGGGGGCCFIFLEARYGNGTMDEVVRRFRDDHLTERNKRGYYKLSEVLVPLMRKSKFIKWLIRGVMTDPLVAYGRYYYGQSKFGRVFKPVATFWLALFDYLGQDHTFIRDNGESV